MMYRVVFFVCVLNVFIGWNYRNQEITDVILQDGYLAVIRSALVTDNVS